MKTLLAFLLLPLACLGQIFMPGADAGLGAAVPIGAEGYTGDNIITNISGYPILSWYVVNDNYSTNSGTATLVNSASWNGNADMTNVVEGAFPTRVVDGLNSKDYLFFDGGDFLRALGVGDYGNAMEAFMVMRYTNNGSERYFFQSAADSAYGGLALWTSYQPYHRYGSSAVSSIPDSLSNTWIVISFINTLEASDGIGMWTNGVSAGKNQTATGETTDNMLVGARWDLGASKYGVFDLAELIVYQTNFALAENAGTFYGNANRSNIFWYLTNKYNLSW